MVRIADLLIDLIELSEKAGRIARLIRERDELFRLLIEQKDEKSKNQRFLLDFKTLADVLIQQLIKYRLTAKYPRIDTIKGEETSEFTGQQGITVELELNDDPDHLVKRLSDHPTAIKLLTEAIYSDVERTQETNIHRRLYDAELPDEDLGVWIDPIDCTNEYIKSDLSETATQSSPFPVRGLRCVTCLIGVFSKRTGKALIGVINLPFFVREQNGGKCVWGVHCRTNGVELSANNVERQRKQSTDSKLKLALSSAESATIINRLSGDYELVFVTGQGYKLYLILVGLVDVFLITKDSTYKWDTCAPSAIFKSIKNDSNQQTGNLLELKSLARDSANRRPLSTYELNYNTYDELVNVNGLIASLDPNLIDEVLIKVHDCLVD